MKVSLSCFPNVVLCYYNKNHMGCKKVVPPIKAESGISIYPFKFRKGYYPGA